MYVLTVWHSGHQNSKKNCTEKWSYDYSVSDIPDSVHIVQRRTNVESVPCDFNLKSQVLLQCPLEARVFITATKWSDGHNHKHHLHNLFVVKAQPIMELKMLMLNVNPQTWEWAAISSGQGQVSKPLTGRGSSLSFVFSSSNTQAHLVRM